MRRNKERLSNYKVKLLFRIGILVVVIVCMFLLRRCM